MVVAKTGAIRGAVSYEYEHPRSMRRILTAKHASDCASFETDWSPGDYLKDYYSVVEPDERRTMAFFVDCMRDAEPDRPVLLFGVGPALHHVFLAARHAAEIHLGDYLPSNLEKIRQWLDRDPAAHDWRPFVRYTLQCEGLASPRESDITQREELTRAKITRLFEVDLRRPDPLGGRIVPPYGTVISAYCADSATADKELWAAYMKRIAGLVPPGGMLLTAALRRSRFYFVGGKKFPSANVDENDLFRLLKRYLPGADIVVEVAELGDEGPKSYSSIVLASARSVT